jgi:hypothetical protein
MSRFARRIRPHVEQELHAARQADDAGDATGSFAFLERAHVLGQASTVEHVRVHWRMLLWALRKRAPREAWGQVFRIVGAATKTAFGLVPTGNTGGSNISPFRRLPVQQDLARTIASARKSNS